MKIEINTHSSICINNAIYVDPLHINKVGKAKYIFITHPHWDHFSIDDINKILTKETILICPKSMQSEVSQFSNEIVFVEPESSYKLKDLEFSTFRAYNINKQFHPKENNWVGYSLKIEGKNIVIVGDSDDTPELRKLQADILLIPIGGTFTMDVRGAAHLTNILQPRQVIPIHYGEIVGSDEMANEFASILNKDVECKIIL